MNKTPAVRFKGFSDEWEQRKLGNLGTLKNGMNFSKDSMGIGFPFVNLQDIFGKSIIDADNLGKAMATPEQLRDYNLIAGDVLFVRSSVKLEGVGETALVAVSLKNTTYSGFIIRFRDETGLDSNFKRFVFATKNVRKQILSQATDSANKNISQTVLSNLELYYPAINEQKAIGVCFSYIDNLITRYQCKYEKLKNIKKSMLYKMFPQNGRKVPKIRFTGFTDDWEQRKLSEIATMHARIGWQNLRKSEFLNSGDYYLITGTDFVDGEVDLVNCHYVTKDRYDQDPNIQIENGSILITKDGTLGKVAYVKGLEKPATLNAGVFNVLIREKKRVYGKYLFQYLKAPFLLDYVAKKATGGTIKHLNQEILVDFPVVLPKYDEQVLLGDTFENIDNLITLHHRKLEKLKQLKQAMLHKMFV